MAVFIEVTVTPEAAADADVRQKLVEVCPVDVFGQAPDGALEIIENKPKSRIATRVPVSGSLEDPDANGWVAAFGLIRNAYIDAFSHGLRLNGKSEKKQ